MRANSKRGRGPTATTRDIVASLPLQMLIYFHSWYSLVYTLVYILIFRYKYLDSSNRIFQIVTPIIFSLWAVVEAARLYIGRTGNLREQTSTLFAFLFLTFFPQLFLMIYLTALVQPLLPFDRIWGAAHIGALALELVFGFVALRKLIRVKTAMFNVEYGFVDSAASDENGGRVRAGDGSAGDSDRASAAHAMTAADGDRHALSDRITPLNAFYRGSSGDDMDAWRGPPPSSSPKLQYEDGDGDGEDSNGGQRSSRQSLLPHQHHPQQLRPTSSSSSALFGPTGTAAAASSTMPLTHVEPPLSLTLAPLSMSMIGGGGGPSSSTMFTPTSMASRFPTISASGAMSATMTAQSTLSAEEEARRRRRELDRAIIRGEVTTRRRGQQGVP